MSDNEHTQPRSTPQLVSGAGMRSTILPIAKAALEQPALRNDHDANGLPIMLGAREPLRFLSALIVQLRDTSQRVDTPRTSRQQRYDLQLMQIRQLDADAAQRKLITGRVYFERTLHGYAHYVGVHCDHVVRFFHLPLVGDNHALGFELAGASIPAARFITYLAGRPALV